MAIEKQASCEDPVEPALLPVEVARARMRALLSPLSRTETVPIRNAVGRVLAADLTSPIDVPAQTNSAMDGYAIAASSIPEQGEATLEVIDTAWAGQPATCAIGSGQAVRIFTGAIMPAGADTVVIQEHVHREGSRVSIDNTVEAGRNVRHAGEDVATGQSVIRRGTRLGPAQIGVMASLGIDAVDVVARPRVAFFSTGDELRALDTYAGQTLPPGAVFDSNRYTLASLLDQLGVDAIDLGIVADTADATRDALTNAASQADIVLSSGGVSAGDADHVTRSLQDVGEVSFWKLAMRPGRPLAFGRIGDAWFFGLPGNPVAVMVTFLQFVQPFIRELGGELQVSPLQLPAHCESKLRKTPGRTEYQRGILERDTDGSLRVRSTGKQGAGRLSSMSDANCLIVLAPEIERVEPGDQVDVQPFHGLLGTF